MLIEDIIINEYINAFYNENYSVYTKEQIEQAYCEYMDLSGMFETKQFQQLSYINYLKVRIAVLSPFVEVQRELISTFGEPHFDFSLAERYHYKLVWKNDKKDFLIQLNKIEGRERKYITELRQKEKIYEEEKDKANPQKKSLKESRIDFIRNITILGKNGYSINRNETTMEEYSIMIKDSTEQNKADNAKSFKHRNRHIKS